MTIAENNPVCAWTQERIEAYLDGVLPEAETERIGDHLDTCAACAGELDLAGQIHAALRALPEPDVPEQVIETVFARIRAERRDEFRQRLRLWLNAWKFPHWRPAAATLAVTVLILMGVFLRRPPEPPATAVSAEELAVAEQQARWALAYVSDVGRRVGLTARDGIVGKPKKEKATSDK